MLVAIATGMVFNIRAEPERPSPPSKSALEMCFQQTVAGGVLAFDHYFCDERWVCTLGERLAIKEFFDDKKIFNLYGTGIFLKL